MITLCPNCGAPFLQQGAFRLKSYDMSILHADQIHRCFCGLTKADLEILAIRMEEKLLQLIEDHWSGITLDELRQNIREMRKGDPLRAELIHRMMYLDRLKDRLKEVQKAEEWIKQYQEYQEQQGSEILGFSEVLALYSRKPDQ